MSYKIFNEDGRPVGDIHSKEMSLKAAKALAEKWFGEGSSVKIDK
jgi:hypothetical protein